MPSKPNKYAWSCLLIDIIEGWYTRYTYWADHPLLPGTIILSSIISMNKFKHMHFCFFLYILYAKYSVGYLQQNHDHEKKITLNLNRLRCTVHLYGGSRRRFQTKEKITGKNNNQKAGNSSHQDVQDCLFFSSCKKRTVPLFTPNPLPRTAKCSLPTTLSK